MRCFVGIPLDQVTREALAAVGEAVRDADPAWRDEKWVAEKNLHITVAFLGDVAATAISPLSDELTRRISGVSAFELPFGRLRAVPNGRRTTMLWAAYDDPEGAAADLAARVGIGAEARDIAVEERAFRAHVTLVRRRRPRAVGARALSALESNTSGVPGFVSVRCATLFASTLTKAGPVYEPLLSWDFSV